jgi:DDB1- and CUL4-associated factor 11
MTQPYPNPYSHPLPTFKFNPKFGTITIHFNCDPLAHAAKGLPFSLPSAHPPASYNLASLPQRKPPGFLDNLNGFITGAGALIGARQAPEPDEVFGGNIDLREDELVDNERDDALEADDDPAPARDVVVLCAYPQEKLGPRAQARRRWEVVPLRTTRAITGAM